MHLYVLGGYLHVIGDAGDPPYVWIPPWVWMPLHVFNTPMHLYVSLHVYVLGVICMGYGGTPLCQGSGASAHLSSFWCLLVHPLDAHMLHLVPFL